LQHHQEHAMHKRPSKAPPEPPLLYEADIGSGEKTPADHETEAMIRQIPALPESPRAPAGGRHEPGHGHQHSGEAGKAVQGKRS
jgi:hypothetical protein